MSMNIYHQFRRLKLLFVNMLKDRLTGNANSSKSDQSASESLPVVSENAAKQQIPEQASFQESTPKAEPEKPEVSEFDPYNRTYFTAALKSVFQSFFGYENSFEFFFLATK